MGSGVRRGSSAERIAEEVLRARGFEIEAARHVVGAGEEKVAEIDFLVRTLDGARYAVEVKAGGGDVQAVRQAYANAHLVGREAILVCKSLAAEARGAADKLGVRVIEIATFYPLLEPEELEILVRGAMDDALERGAFSASVESVADEDEDALRVLAHAATPETAAQGLAVPLADLGSVLGRLKRRRLLPARSLAFADASRAASAVLAKLAHEKRLRRIEEALERIERTLERNEERLALSTPSPQSPAVRDATSLDWPARKT